MKVGDIEGGEDEGELRGLRLQGACPRGLGRVWMESSEGRVIELEVSASALHGDENP